MVAVALLLTACSASGVALHGFSSAVVPQSAVATTASLALPLPDAALLPDPAPVAEPSASASASASASPAPSASPSRAAAVSPSASPVRPLGALQVPDLLVEVPGGLSAAQLKALDDVKGVTALTALDVGTVALPSGRTGRVAGVDPSTFRAFTPSETASSDPLWQSVARGELASSYDLQRRAGLELGKDLQVTGSAPVQGRLGAVAAFAVPHVDLVVRRDVAQRLGVQRSTAVLLAAPSRTVGRLRAAVLAVTGKADVTVLRPERVPAVTTGKPRTYLELYQQSARYCRGLSWTVLAAIGQVESGHGRNNGPSSAGALGPMQFLPSTWASYGVDGDRDGDADINDPFDAVPAAALYLCRNGAGRDAQGLYDGIFAYNHADWYVRKVLALAEQYRQRG
ncbi:MAG: Lytic transglycosylase catalytic [Frankiales bacterium]|nr:Lytic transglycosylase catalytic [Frankiales bacterium]